MRFAVSFLLASLAVVLVAARPEDSKYTTKYDNIDVDQILKSDRLLGNYFKCLMDRGSCTPDASELKKVLPEALETGCAKCTDKQREISEKVIKYLVDNKKDMWDELRTKFDPENKYSQKFQAQAKEHGIELKK